MGVWDGTNAKPCADRKVEAGNMELYLRCQLNSPGHGGHCRMVLVDDVIVMWPRETR